MVEILPHMGGVIVFSGKQLHSLGSIPRHNGKTGMWKGKEPLILVSSESLQTAVSQIFHRDRMVREIPEVPPK